VCAVQSHRHV